MRLRECEESLRIVEQCLGVLKGKYAASPTFDVRAMVPKKIKPPSRDLYFRAENPKGELGFFLRPQANSNIPWRLKVRSPSFCNLSVLPELCRGVLISDLIAILGSLDLVMGEVDR